MPICEIRCWNSPDCLKRCDRIITTALYLRDDSQESFDRYVLGLTEGLHHRDRYFPGFALLLFIDATVTNNRAAVVILDERLRRHDAVVVFHCPAVQLGPQHGHQGHFGMLVRYFPIFGYVPECAKMRYCITIDADYKEYDWAYVAGIYRWLARRPSVRLAVASNTLARYIRWRKPAFFPVYGGYIVCRGTLPQELLRSYITAATETPERFKKFFRRGSAGFPYGFDELFWNMFVIPYLQKEGSRFGVHCKWSYERLLGGLLYQHNEYSRSRVSTLEESDLRRLKTLLRSLGYGGPLLAMLRDASRRVPRRVWSRLDAVLRRWRTIGYSSVFLENQLDFALLNGCEAARGVMITFEGDKLANVQTMEAKPG